MKEVYDLLIKLQPGVDKLYHLYYGCILSVLLFLFFNHKSYWIYILAFIVGIGKELMDVYLGLGDFEFMDIYYTVIPVLVPMIIIKKWERKG